jgi:hypothetical protein
MTEAEWLTCDEPQRLFGLIERKASQRKCVLFSVACHQLPPAYDPSFPNALKKQAGKFTAAVDFADGRIDVAEVRRLWLRQGEDRSLPERGREWASAWACQTVWDFEDPFESDVAGLVREVFGNPFRPTSASPAWRTPDVLSLANGIYEDRAFDRLPILADALQEAGCEDTEVLGHCRGNGRHVRGCWVIDLLLGKE